MEILHAYNMFAFDPAECAIHAVWTLVAWEDSP